MVEYCKKGKTKDISLPSPSPFGSCYSKFTFYF